MKLSKNHISTQSIVLAVSLFVGSNSFAFAASQDNAQDKSAGTKTNEPATASITAGNTGNINTSNSGTANTAANAGTTNTGAAKAGAANTGAANTGAAKASAANTGAANASAANTGAANASAANAGTASTGTASTGTATSATAQNNGKSNTSSSATASASIKATETVKPVDSPDTKSNAVSSDIKPPTASTSNPSKWRPGMELTIGTDTQDLVPTDDPELARKQVEAYPDSPEAAFILAVALTRTSRVEEALEQVRKARKLADQKGGATYFDKMIGTYEDLLKNYPKENRVRYGLAWAYYMKAYLLASYSRKVANWKAKNPDPAKALAAAANGTASQATPTPAPPSDSKSRNADVAKAFLASASKSGKPMDLGSLLGQVSAMAQGNPSAIPKIPEFMDGVEAQDIPQIRKYFEQALVKMDELIAQKPDDVWALVYRAHLKAEYSGNIDEAMKTWQACSEKYPNNPASYFFLGEGYLKKGDLKKSISHASKAVALRGMGF